ncbi:YfcC family protein [Phaeodactylibacter luteus]|uniref:Putative basic amino acid antiporter YfcC n=1 Tax=Phaeodactylibacter luteus TaxID=1564516 RepID=A0A5C6RW37_9BACT|nr:TIGR00366 family protein [Phaeodactylibacter luteus]TXB65582.1 putative basic amino acid antiporter YfcC [Phaeodactylibacter luteus]
MKKFPDTLVIILGIMAVFAALTWIIPAGEFARAESGGRAVIVPGSYELTASSPQGLGAVLMAPARGFISAAQIIAFVFLVGGAFGTITRTGAIDSGLQQIVAFSQSNPRYKRSILPLVITLFSLAGATFGMSEEVLVFVLITIPLARALGYDTITGVAISFVGAGLGFAGAFINPFTVGVAQGIAELPPGSGLGYRLAAWGCITLTGIVYIMRYAGKVEQHPEMSPVYEAGGEDKPTAGTAPQHHFTAAHKAILLLLAAAIGLLVYGVSNWGWYINEIAALFIATGLIAGAAGRLGWGKGAAAFKEGAGDMLTAALVIAMAKGLIVIAEDGKIIDTLLHAMASATAGLPKAVTVELMFALQTALNFFVPSGSGQAALTMPIMAPLSDLLGIGRQTAVLAFQFGDGLSNLIIPTSGVTMGVLAIARIPYQVWAKWFLPLFLWLCLVCMLLLLPPVLWFEWA